MPTNPVAPLRDPFMDGSGGWPTPDLSYGMNFRDYGSYGLRQFGGWIREEFLQQLVGREASRVYREMYDNSSVVGSIMFAILQAMRQAKWRVDPASDKGAGKAEAEFVESCMEDMSHTWEDFVIEALSMLIFGFSICEIVYKRRMGRHKETLRANDDPRWADSDYDDGKIGWRRLPIRGQETIIRWFFDENGQIKGFTQQPWVGTLIDLPIQKCLLFRPIQHKNNPEGRSILRNCYRSYYFVQKLEEQEGILFERMGGIPVLYCPSPIIDGAAGGNPQALATFNMLKRIVTNVRIDEQMGIVLPSDTWRDNEGKPSAVKMFEFQLVTPQHGRMTVNANDTIERHKVDMLMTLLCDFIKMGHEVRGTNNLAVTKVDMFYKAIEGWLHSISAVLNRYALPRLWDINALDMNLMPQFRPEMPDRLDLDSIGTFIKNLADAGMPLFPDDDLQRRLRENANLPEETSAEAVDAAKKKLTAEVSKPNGKTNGSGKAKTNKSL